MVGSTGSLALRPTNGAVCKPVGFTLEPPLAQQGDMHVRARPARLLLVRTTEGFIHCTADFTTGCANERLSSRPSFPRDVSVCVHQQTEGGDDNVAECVQKSKYSNRNICMHIICVHMLPTTAVEAKPVLQ